MAVRTITAAALIIGTGALAPSVLAQEGRGVGANPLPPGPGRDIVAVACWQCHGLNAFTWLRQGEQAWRHQVYDMILRGTQISPSEINTVVTYLTTNFGPG
jgi:mono/diheme cytochrome c family protein